MRRSTGSKLSDIRCKDCREAGVTTSRPAPHPGPRCATHHREFKKRSSDRAHGKRLEATYGITSEEYWRLYDFQGGVCAVCRRATGATKRLAVDHDHESGFVRMLACGPCNQHFGYLRDDPEAFRRAAFVLENPPAFDVIGRRKVPDGNKEEQ